jgi:hypothetical protein
MQSLKGADAENIGYIIPTNVIYHFLSDYERNGKYTGFPAMGILWQKLENPALRASLRMKPDQKVLLFVILFPVVVAKKTVVRVLR